MARRTTDLLDVFRDRGAGQSGKREEPAAPKAPKKPFEGLFLHPRQLLLGSSVVVLLLVFAFVLGLSMGRRGGSSGQALQANAPRAEDPEANVRRVYVLGRVPVTSTTGLAANEPGKLVDVLASDRFGVDPARIWIAGDPNDPQQWIVFLGPFATEKQATDYLSSHRLTTARLGGSHAPFQRPVYRNLLPGQLPRTRLPGGGSR